MIVIMTIIIIIINLITLVERLHPHKGWQLAAICPVALLLLRLLVFPLLLLLLLQLPLPPVIYDFKCILLHFP